MANPILWICLWEGPSVIFKHKYRKSYSNINFCLRRAEAERKAPRTKYRGYGENFLYSICKLCILVHSTVICFLLVKSIIVANDDQLQITHVILWTSFFFLQKLVKFQLYFGTEGGTVPVDPVLNMALSSVIQNIVHHLNMEVIIKKSYVITWARIRLVLTPREVE